MRFVINNKSAGKQFVEELADDFSSGDLEKIMSRLGDSLIYEHALSGSAVFELTVTGEKHPSVPKTRSGILETIENLGDKIYV